MARPKTTPPAHVLVVDDDRSVRDVVRRGLGREGHSVSEADTGTMALEGWIGGSVDIAVLDLHLPDMTGLDVMAELRKSDPSLYVIMLTGAGSEADRVLGLVNGADDYMVKPFSVRELAARVAAVQRRRGQLSPPEVIDIAGLRVDTASRGVWLGSEPVDLTRLEFDLLHHFVTNPGRAFSRQELLESVWGSSAEWQSSATVTEHVRRLRQKIDDPEDPVRIVTVRGSGYRFDS